MPRSPGSIKTRVADSRGKGDYLAHKSASSIITSTDGTTEKVNYVSASGGSVMPVTHPYIGPNSWIRVMPESMSTIVVGSKGEDGEPYIQAYLRNPSLDSSKDIPAIQATEKDKFYQRRLQEGEVDIMSNGIAGSFYSKNGNLELRGGSVSLTLSAYDLEAQSRAPTHVRAVMGNKRQQVGDEERFGVVRRPNALSKSVVTDPTISDIVKVAPAGGAAGAAVASATGNVDYAKEHLMVLKDKTGFPLVDRREGNVIGDDGTILNSDVTGNPLRSRVKYGTTLKTATITEVDENGNVTLTLPITATKGFIGNFPTTSIDITVGKDVLISALRNVVIDILGKMEVTGPLFNANTVAVKLVKGADNHLVRGEDLIKWLTAHTHSSATGTTSPPINISTLPTILSKTGMVK